MNRLSCTGPGFDHRVAATRFAHADIVGPEHREWSLTAQLSTVPGKGGTTFGGLVVALVWIGRSMPVRDGPPRDVSRIDAPEGAARAVGARRPIPQPRHREPRAGPALRPGEGKKGLFARDDVHLVNRIPGANAARRDDLRIDAAKTEFLASSRVHELQASSPNRETNFLQPRCGSALTSITAEPIASRAPAGRFSLLRSRSTKN